MEKPIIQEHYLINLVNAWYIVYMGNNTIVVKLGQNVWQLAESIFPQPAGQYIVVGKMEGFMKNCV